MEYSPLKAFVSVRRCSRGLVYYWCKQACPLLPREKQPYPPQELRTRYKGRIFCQLPFSGAASSAVVAAFSWIIERKYAMFNLSTVSSG